MVRTLMVRGMISVAASMMLVRCGNPPVAAPEVHTGSVRIVAMDTAVIPWISIALDDVPYGLHQNPYLLNAVVVGVHKLAVTSQAGLGASTMVDVQWEKRSDATVQLLSAGPYVGRVAPTFTATSIDGQTMDLQQLRGKVVLLAFFEHTWLECIQTELPSFQWSLAAIFSPNQFLVIGVNNTSSNSWLINYRNMRGISFPFIYDSNSQIFTRYEVGGAYGNNPPSYVLIDSAGIVRFRSDNKFGQTDTIASIVSKLTGQ